MRGKFTAGGDMTFANTRALSNPFIGCIQPLGKIVVGYDALWQVGTVSGKTRPPHPQEAAAARDWS